MSGYTIAYFQENPTVEAEPFGVFGLGKDGRVWLQTKDKSRPYKHTLVTPDGHVLLSNCDEFLRELARQSKMSQFTYHYTQDEMQAAQIRALLMGFGG